MKHKKLYIGLGVGLLAVAFIYPLTISTLVQLGPIVEEVKVQLAMFEQNRLLGQAGSGLQSGTSGGSTAPFVSCLVDLNRDNQLNQLDFDAFNAAFRTQNLSVADFDRNNVLNVQDFSSYLNAYALGCMRDISTFGTVTNPTNPPTAPVTGDESYLYQDGQSITTTVTTRPNGKETFEVKRVSDGRVLRSSFPTENFYTDNSNGALRISYDIRKAPGGVDIEYSIQNPTGAQQNLPGFKIEGVNQDNGNLSMLTKDERGEFVPINTQQAFIHMGGFSWPNGWIYSPVMVLKSNNLAIGTSIQYPYLIYKNDISPSLFGYNPGANNTQWTISYVHERDHGHEDENGVLLPYPKINAYETRTYKVTLRFAEPRYWLYTLADYKKYLDLIYPVTSSRVKDRTPVIGANVSDATFVSTENPAGYVPLDICTTIPRDCLRIDKYGWGPMVNNLMLPRMIANGYKRLMIWTPSGSYRTVADNFPTEFTSLWPANAVGSSNALSAIKSYGIKLGLWWGRSGEVNDGTWAAPQLRKARPVTNSLDRNELRNEFILAKNYGADEVGLDAFVVMNNFERSGWIDEMKQIAPNIHLISEVGGADFLQRKGVTNAYTDTPTTPVKGPHILAWYFNPQAELWVADIDRNPYFSYVQQLTKWGFTYVGLTWPIVDVKNLDYTPPKCMDIARYGANSTWPRNSQCESLTDESN